MVTGSETATINRTQLKAHRFNEKMGGSVVEGEVEQSVRVCDERKGNYM